MADNSSNSSQSTMKLKIFSPFRVYFNDQAYSVSGVNQTGPFDILPKHHNFMTLLPPGELVIKAPKGETKVKIAQGIMHIKKDMATVFLDV